MHASIISSIISNITLVKSLNSTYPRKRTLSYKSAKQ